MRRLAAHRGRQWLDGRARRLNGPPPWAVSIFAQEGEDQSGFRQVREYLVEKRLSVGKRKPLGLAQELFPRGGVESGTQAGLILFGESDRAGVEVGEKLSELCGNGPGVRRGDGRGDIRCRRARCEGGTEPGQ